MNNVKDSLRNRLADDSNSASIPLKPQWIKKLVEFQTTMLKLRVLCYVDSLQQGRQPFSCGVPNQSTNRIQRATQQDIFETFRFT
ncbi:hypothetical protein TNCV_3391311 [Trichonephila clavipes]|nr:hypothetical protein TNCV_3391311 [Trichonephila clavipes]